MQADSNGLWFWASVKNPDGTVLVQPTIAGTGHNYIDVFTLPQTGTYTIFVDPYQATSGLIDVNVRNVPDDPALSSPVFGTPVTLNITTPGQNGSVTFSGHTGQRISMQADSNGLWFWASVKNPDGTVLVQPTIAGTGHNYIDVFTLPQTGTYTIFVDPYQATTGLIDVTVWNVPDDPALSSPVFGTPVTLNITTPGQNGSVTFSGHTGQRISMQADSNGLWFWASVKNPDGTVLVQPTIAGSGHNYIDVFTLPQTGTYTIFVDPYQATTGLIDVTVWNVPDDPALSSPVFGTPVTLNITTPGQNGSVTFSGHTGQRISMQADSNGLWFWASVKNPDGTVLVQPTIAGSGHNYIDVFTLPQTGTYTIFVDPYQATSGLIDVNVRNVPDDPALSSPVFGTPVTLNITTPGQNGSVTFSGHTGQRISMQADSNGLWFWASVKNPDGTVLVQPTIAGTGHNYIDVFTLPQTGTYTIFVDPYQATTGLIDVTVWNVPDDPALSSPVFGTPVTLNITTPGQNGSVTFSGHTGQRISMQADSNGLWFWASVKNPDGTVLVQPTIAGSGHNYIDVFTLPQTGTYTIFVDPYQATSGLIDVNVRNVPDDPALSSPVFGTPVTLNITTPGQNGSVTFSGHTGQRISMQADSNGLWFWASVKNPDGTVLVQPTIAGTGHNYIDVFTLPQTGTYTIFVDPYQATTGLIDVTVWNVPDDPALSSPVFGTPVTLNITTPGQNGSVTFSGHTGQRISMQADSNGLWFWASVKNPDGTVLVQPTIAGSGHNYIDVFTLPQTGTYTIFVDPYQATTGLIDVTVWNVPDDPALSSPVFGTPVTLNITTPGQNGSVTFSGHTGQRISMQADSNGLWFWASVKNPDGTVLVQPTIAGSGHNYIDVFTLPQTGTYTIFVDPYQATTGLIDVTVWNVPDDPALSSPVFGTPVTLNITTPGQNGSVTFSGHTGQRISMQADSNGLWFWASVKNPDGTVLVQPTIAGSGHNYIDVFTLPQTGTYTIFVDPYQATTGLIDVTVWNVPDDPALSSPVFGTPVTLNITTPGQNGSVTFSGHTGQRISMQADSNGLWFWASVKNPDGTVLVQPTIAGSGHNYIDVFTLPQTGTYTIFVDPYQATTGLIDVTVWNVPDDPALSSPVFGTPVTLNITTPGQNGSVTFSGHTGQRISMQADSNGLWFWASVKNPDGTVLVQPTIAGSGHNYIDVFTLPQTGTYTIFVDPYQATTGLIDVTVWNVPDDPALSSPVFGTPVTLNITTPGQNGSVTFSGHTGQRISMQADSNGLWFWASVKNPDGTVLVQPTIAGSGHNYIDVFTLPQTGTYTIFVDPYQATTGLIDVTVWNVPDDPALSSPVFGTPVTLNITTPGQNGSVTFSGHTGQRISMQADSNGLWFWASVKNPDGTVLIQPTIAGSGHNYIDVFTLPQTG